ARGYPGRPPGRRGPASGRRAAVSFLLLPADDQDVPSRGLEVLIGAALHVRRGHRLQGLRVGEEILVAAHRLEVAQLLGDAVVRLEAADQVRELLVARLLQLALRDA